MDSKQSKQEHSVARFASIALLHLSLDQKKSKAQAKLRNQQALASSSADDSDQHVPFDTQTITLDQLVQLREHFDRNGGELVEDAFVAAFTAVGTKMSEKHLRWWFRRIDANDSGGVDWSELSAFIIAGTVDEAGRIVSHEEHPEDAMFSKEDTGPSMAPTAASPNAVAGFNHSDLVTVLYCHPRNGKYYTGSQDGTVRVWDAQTLEFEYILHQGKWVTAMCASGDHTQLFVAGLDRSITVYEVNNPSRAPRYYVGNILDEHHRVPRIRPLHRFEIQSRNVPDLSSGSSPGGGFRESETLEQFRLRNERLRNRQAVGDQTVEAHILRQMDFPAHCLACVPDSDLLAVGLSSGRLQTYPLVHRSLVRGRVVDCTLNCAPHDNFPMTTLQYAEFFSGFLSTAADGSVSLTDVKSALASSSSSSSHAACCVSSGTGGVTRVGTAANPIYHAVWMEGARLLATCGAAREISLWSASPQTSTMTLSGHFSSVVQLSYDANDNWLISLDMDRMIIIWNMYNTQPIQSIADYDTYQLKRFSVCLYDHIRNRIVCCSAAPVMFTKGTTSVPLADPSYKGHQRPIVGCLYNPVFEQVITADSECIKIWDAHNGENRACLSVPSLRASGIPMKYAGGGSITCIRQDATCRRLIIGLSSATVCVMSLANCHLQLECHRNTVKMLPAVDSGMVCYVPTPAHSRTGKKGLGLIVGAKLLLWEDKESLSNAGVLREVAFHMRREFFEMLAAHQQTELHPSQLVAFRSPQPICLGAGGDGLVFVGTDCGIVLIYTMVSPETQGFVGTYDPKVTVTSVAWHAETQAIVCSLSNGRLTFTSASHRNKHISIVHQDIDGVPAPLICFDIKYGHVATGDEDGTVHTWRMVSLDFESVMHYATVTASRDCGASVMRYIHSFRAHTGEVSSLSLMPCGGATSSGNESGADYGDCYVLSASSDCQVRVFTLTGLVVGYVGSPWSIGTYYPRAVLRTVPAPIFDIQTTKSFLHQYLPGMPNAQDSEPRIEYVAETQALVLDASESVELPSSTKSAASLAARNTPRRPKQSSSTLTGRGNEPTSAAEVVESTSNAQLPSVPSARQSPRQPRAQAPTVPDTAGGVRRAALEFLGSPRAVGGGAAAHHKPLGVNRSLRAACHTNPILSSDARQLLVDAAAASEAMSTMDASTSASGRPLHRPSAPTTLPSQATQRTVTFAGKRPVASLQLDALVFEARYGNARRKVSYAPIVEESMTSGGDGTSKASMSLTSPRNDPMSIAFGADADTVASMVPLLHLDRIPRRSLPLTTVEEEAKTVHHQPSSSRLDEWRQRHRLWVAEQINANDMIKSSRPMATVRLHSMDAEVEQTITSSVESLGALSASGTNAAAAAGATTAAPVGLHIALRESLTHLRHSDNSVSPRVSPRAPARTGTAVSTAGAVLKQSPRRQRTEDAAEVGDE